MLVHSIKGDSKVPHRDNIFDIVNSHPILTTLKWTNATIAGGFATALLVAPRSGQRGQYISRRYYTDIDIYPQNQANRIHIHNVIEDTYEQEIFKKHETPRATTYSIKLVDPNNRTKWSIHNVQVMDMAELEGEVSNIFKTYDFTVAVAAIKLETQDIWLHEDLVAQHINKELELFKPHCFEINSPPEDIIVQLLRMQKYCKRWGYTLSKNTLLCLMAVYNARPEIQLDPTKAYKVDSGDSNGILTHSDANIWKLLTKMIKNNPHWNDSYDIHGVITGVGKHKKTPITLDISSQLKQMLV